VDGQPLAKGRRVRVVVTRQSHQLVCKPDEYRAKEEFVQPPYDPTHAIGFTFLIEDKLQIVDKLAVEESETTAEPVQPSAGPCNIQTSDTLAVLPFSVNARGQEVQRMGEVLAESVTVRLINARMLRVIERAQIDQLVKEADRETLLSQTGLMNEKTVQSVGNLIGAKYLVVGNVIVIENALQVTGRVLNVKTGEILMASQVAGPKENVFALGQKLATNIANQMKGCVGTPVKAAQ
jgi:TolB-like protein